MSRLRAALHRFLDRVLFEPSRHHLWWDETDRLPAMGRALNRSKP